MRFKISKHGDVRSVGTNDVKVKVLGSSITYGSGGPKVDVRMSMSADGSSWSDLFSAKAIASGDEQTLVNMPGAQPLSFRFSGRYSWLFNKTYTSDGRDGHVYILKNGDTPPAYAPFDNQQSLQTFLKNVLDSRGKVSIGPKDLLYVVELGALDRSSDFQDAVILVTFQDKAATCTDPSKARVHVQFNRIENTGTGDAAKQVFVGTNKLAFSEDQWIPLVDSAGTAIIDGGLVENVKGLAFERGNGWVRLVSHGSHPNSSGKEIVDAKVAFNHAIITSIENDPENTSEAPFDGVVTDNANGDEYENGPNAKSMIMKSRVTTADDGVYLYWQAGEPSDAVNSSSSSAQSSSAESTTVVSDACSVPYQLDSRGMLTLRDKADVTVHVIGSESTYGLRGPRVDVRAQVSTDGGSVWKQLFGYKTLRGGELAVLKDTASGSRIALSFNGRYSWVFNKTVTSGFDTSAVKLLRNGETFSGLKAIEDRNEMRKYLRELLNDDAGIKLGAHDIAFLVELGDVKRPNYHDAVVILSIDKPASAGACSTAVSSSSSSAGGTSSSSSSSSSLSATADADSDGVKNGSDLCPLGTAIPESVPTEYMSFDRYALTATRGNANSVPLYRTGPRKKVSDYSLQDTRGCSCTQILDAIEDKGYNLFADYPVLKRSLKNLFSFYVRDARKFGCPASLLKLVSDSTKE